jgi:hypothetical protein
MWSSRAMSFRHSLDRRLRTGPKSLLLAWCTDTSSLHVYRAAPFPSSVEPVVLLVSICLPAAIRLFVVLTVVAILSFQCSYELIHSHSLALRRSVEPHRACNTLLLPTEATGTALPFALECTCGKSAQHIYTVLARKYGLLQQ